MHMYVCIYVYGGVRGVMVKWNKHFDKSVHTFSKGFCLKVNVIARLGFELVYYDVAI